MANISPEHMYLVDVAIARRKKHLFHMKLIGMIREQNRDSYIIQSNSKEQVMKTFKLLSNQLKEYLVERVFSPGMYGFDGKYYIKLTKKHDS